MKFCFFKYCAKKDTFKVRMLIKSKKINKNIIKFVRINNNLYFCAC